MSEQAVAGLRAEAQAIRDFGRSLSTEEWDRPSACWGWSVKDVFSHMGCVFHGFVEPDVSPLPAFEDVELENEVPVATRRSWSPKEVLEEFEEFSEPAIEVLASFQAPEVRDAPFPAGTLGTYPTHQFANALMFDHFTHLRFDLLAPFGSIERPHPELDEDRVRPGVEWLLAGMNTMSAVKGPIMAVLTKPVVINLTGPGGGTWMLRPGPADSFLVEEDPGATEGAARATGSAYLFEAWATKRLDWRRAGVRLTGDEDLAARVFDAINVI